jgi:hypothetical protein
MDGARKRGAQFQAPFLAREDTEDFIPKHLIDTHVGITVLMQDKELPEWRMRKDMVEKMRRETYSNVLKLYNKYGSKDFDVFYNVHAEEIVALGLNRFVMHDKIAPIAHLIECFQTKWTSPNTHKKRRVISFGIRWDILDAYGKAVQEARDNGTKLVLPELPRNGQEPRKSLAIFGSAAVEINDGEKHMLKPERNALYNQFVAWCKADGISVPQGLMQAMDLIIQQRPHEEVKEIEHYRIVTEFDKQIMIPTTMADQEKYIKVNGELYAKTMDIIRRYNADPRNLAKGNISFSVYCNNALVTQNSKAPLKYRDPEAYEQMLRAKEADEYNRKVAGVEDGTE